MWLWKCLLQLQQFKLRNFCKSVVWHRWRTGAEGKKKEVELKKTGTSFLPQQHLFEKVLHLKCVSCVCVQLKEVSVLLLQICMSHVWLPFMIHREEAIEISTIASLFHKIVWKKEMHENEVPGSCKTNIQDNLGGAIYSRKKLTF